MLTTTSCPETSEADATAAFLAKKGAVTPPRYRPIVTPSSAALACLTPPRQGSVTCTALHPGACRTELGRYLFDPSVPANPLVYPVLAAGVLVTRSPKEGAQTQIACAADPALVKGRGAGGQYYVGPKISELPSALARDPEAAERMWAASERLVGKFAV